MHVPKRKNEQMFSSANPGLELEIPGVYQIPCGCGKHQIPCGCGKLCVGQKGGTMETRCKEYQRYMRLHQPDKSAVHMPGLLPLISNHFYVKLKRQKFYLLDGQQHWTVYCVSTAHLL